MLAIPAIDIMHKKVVRLYRGNKESVKVYSDSPKLVAQQWKDQGAKLLHIVDLDAVFGNGNNIDVIKDIIDLGIEVQVGGGVRSLKRAEDIIRLGAKRIIIGTKALDPDLLDDIFKVAGDKLGVSVDVLDGKIMKLGWQEKTDHNFIDFVNYIVDKGVKWVIYTDISRDGTLKGVDIEEVKKISNLKGANIIISGGISSRADLIKIRNDIPFVYGIIIGKAFYEGMIEFKDAIEFLS